MAEITLLDTWTSTENTDNWYAEPFTKRTACQVPGQCDDDCDCGCPYTTMTDVDQLPLIEKIAAIFPNEWLAFIVAPTEDDDYEPTHGKLIAHSPNPDEVYDAVNTVLWNQHIYVYFNGSFDALRNSYGDTWAQQIQPTPGTPPSPVVAEQPPDDLIELIYSALDQLNHSRNVKESMRRLRLARAKTAPTDDVLITILDTSLDQLESPGANIDNIIWYLEDELANFNVV